MSSQRVKQIATTGLRMYLWFALAQFIVGLIVGGGLALSGVDVQTFFDTAR